jgi:hypothetical protein
MGIVRLGRGNETQLLPRKVQESQGDFQNLKRWKIALIKHLYEIGYEERDILRIFRFIDWLIQLPEELENEFRIEIEQYEEERRMPYVTSVERMGIKKGLKQGIELGLEIKFGNEGLLVMPEINKIEDLDVLKAVQSGIWTAKTLDVLRKIYQSVSATQEKN